MKILNRNNVEPNVLHFHGENINQLAKTFEYILKNHRIPSYDNSNLDIISCWTDDSKCKLYQQCKANNINLINAVPDNYDRSSEWYMPNKIIFYINALKQSTKDYVLLLDGYDVLLAQLNNIIEKYKKQKYKILFNASCNNYPDILMDKLYNRSSMGTYRYFNAGCCIGDRQSLIDFYTESLKYINVSNPYNSEQLVMRYAFKKYALDKNQTYVGIDYNSDIFQSMGYIKSETNQITGITKFITADFYNEKKYTIIISDGILGKKLSERMMLDKFDTVFNYDFNVSLDKIDGICEALDINYIFIIRESYEKYTDIEKYKNICDKYGIKLVYNLWDNEKDIDYGTALRSNIVYGKNYINGLRKDNEKYIISKYRNNYYTYIDDFIVGLSYCRLVNEKLLYCMNYHEKINEQQFIKTIRYINEDIEYIEDKDNNSFDIGDDETAIDLEYISTKEALKIS